MQETVTYVVGAACLVWVAVRIFRIFRPEKKDESPCARCAGGCEAKRMRETRKEECGTRVKKKKKSCCG